MPRKVRFIAPDGRTGTIEAPDDWDDARITSEVDATLGLKAAAPKEEVGFFRGAGLGLGRSLAGTQRTLALAAAAPAISVDKIASMVMGRPVTAAQDFAFGVAAPAAELPRRFEIDPNTQEFSTGGKVGNVIGNIGGMMGQMAVMPGGGGAGGLSAITGAAKAAPTIAKSVFAAAKAAAPFVPGIVTKGAPAIVPPAIDMGAKVAEAGGTLGDVARVAGTNAALNTAAVALPLSAAGASTLGGAVKRAATGVALGLPANLAQQAGTNVALGDEFKQLQTPVLTTENILEQGAIPGVMAALFGPRAAGVSAARPAPKPAPKPAGVDASVFEQYRPFLEANGITSPDDPRAQTAVMWLSGRDQRRLDRTVPLPETVDDRAQTWRIPTDTPPEQRPQGIADSPIAQIYVDAAGRAVVPEQTGTRVGVMSAAGTEARSQREAGQAFEQAIAQRERKQGAQDITSMTGEPRDVSEVRSSGTASAEGTAAVTPEKFQFLDVQRDNTGRATKAGPQVKILGETTIKVGEETRPAFEVEYERPNKQTGGYDTVREVVDAGRVSDLSRPKNPRFAQDIAETTYSPPEPPPGVEGIVGSLPPDGTQPAPRRAGQRIDTDPNRASIQRPPEPVPEPAPQPRTIDGEATRVERERVAAEDARRKAEAPDPAGFVLSGSNRPADQAAARGQSEMFTPDGEARPRVPGSEGLSFGPNLTVMAREIKAMFKDAADLTGRGVEALRGGPVGRFVSWAVDSTAGHLRTMLRGTNSKTANEVMDMFAEHAGVAKGQGEVYSAAVDAYRHRNIGEIAKALEPFMGDKAALKQVVNLIRNPSSIRRGTDMGDAALAVRKVLDDTLKYMRDAGVDVGEVRNGYYPREFDYDAVTKDPAGFLKAVEQAYRETGMSRTDAAEAAKALHASIEYGATGSLFDADLGAPKASFVKNRTFGKQVDNASHPLNRFLTADPTVTLAKYIERSARRAEFARRLGNNGEKWAEMERKMIADGLDGEQIAAVKGFVQLAAGMRNTGLSRRAVQTIGWARTWATMMFMEKAVLSSLSEFVTPAIRAADGNPLRAAGEVARSLNTTIQALRKKGDTAALRDLGEDLGILASSQLDTMNAHRFSGGELLSDKQARANDGFFRLTGLTQWTEATRIGAIDIGRVFMRRLAKRAAEGDRLSERHLSELGIQDPKAFADWLSKTNDGIPEVADLVKGPQAEAYKVAMRRFVRQSIMAPDATTRPAWMQSGVGQLVGQLQSFNYAFYENVWKRNARLMGEAVRGKDAAGNLWSLSERARLAMPMLMMPVLVAAAGAIGEARDALLGDKERREEEDATKKALKAASRGAPIAPIDPFLNWISSARYNRGSAEQLVGPFLGKMTRFIDSATNFRTRNSEDTNTAERKLAKEFYDLVIEPSIHLAISMAPTMGLAGTLAKAAAMQVAGAGATREKAFVEPVAGEREYQ